MNKHTNIIFIISHFINIISLVMNNTININEDKMVKDVYNEIASHFDNTRAYVWSWIQEFLDKIPDDKLYADIGCGNGRNLRKNNCVGIDNCIEFVKICREKYPEIQVLEGCFTDIPIKKNECDFLICIAAFHHLTTIERRIKALHELKRIIKPGVEHRLLLSVWSVNQPEKTRRTFTYGDNIVKWNKFGKIYERYYYIFKMDEIKELFEITGWTIASHKWDCGNEVFELYYIE